MRKSELFQTILQCVANETELTCEEILSPSKIAEVVDARHIVVWLLNQEDVYIVDIARNLNISRRAAEKIVTTFKGRLDSNRKQFKLAFERVSNELRKRGVLTD